MARGRSHFPFLMPLTSPALDKFYHLRPLALRTVDGIELSISSFYRGSLTGVLKGLSESR